MSWSEVQPGLHQRPLGENERFIKLIGDRAHGLGREHWSCTSLAKFEVTKKDLHDEALIAACTEAWANLRFEHPTIATLSNESNLEYEVPGAQELAQWTEETFQIHREHLELDDLLASLKPARYVVAHLLLDASIIVLHFPHWRTDGYGALLLVNACLAHLSTAIAGTEKPATELSWGSEVSRLLPSVEEALDLPNEATAEVKEQAQKYLATAALLHSTTGLAVSEGTEQVVMPQGTRRVDSSFSVDQTRKILGRCQEEGITIEAAVQASCGAVTYSEAANQAKSKSYTSTMRFSLRDNVRSHFPGNSYAAAICTGGYLVQVPPSQSWLENAKQYTNLYNIGVTPGLVQTRRQYAATLIQVLSRVPPPPSPVTSEIDISSVGDANELVLPRHTTAAGDIVLEVKEIGIGVEILTRQVYCFVWIYRDELHLCLAYNEAFYSQSRVKDLVQSLQQTLLKSLDV